MRPCFSWALVVLVGLSFAAAPPAQAQHPQTRDGFWFGFGFGYGSLGRSCDGCSDIDRESAFSGYLKLGGTVSPKVLLGGESTGWTKSESGFTLTAGSASAAVYFYPQPATGFFLKSGVGFATYQEEGEDAATGFGFIIGLGYDIRVGRNVSLTPVGNFTWGSLGDVESAGLIVPGLKTNVFQLALGVTFH